MSPARARAGLGPLLLTILTTGCGAQSAPNATPPAALAAGTEATALGYASPARWEFHPPAPEGIRARLRLVDGTCVIAATDGQRWTVTPPRGAAGASSTKGPDGPLCTGRAQASSALSGEELVGIHRRSASSWLFVGESGALYEASEALGPFSRTTPPPEPLVKVVGSGAALLAVTRDGRLLRWGTADGSDAENGAAPDAGANARAGAADTDEEPRVWRPATTLAARIADVAIADTGRGLALAYPEALFTTENGGVTWSPAPTAERVGAHRVGVGADGTLMAEGILESLVWDPRRNPPWLRSQSALTGAVVEESIEVGRAPSAAAVIAGRALIHGDRYYEVAQQERDGEGWILARGGIQGRLEAVPLAWSRECSSLKLGGHGKMLVTACVRLVNDEVVAQIRRSDDAGATWRDLGDLGAQDDDLVTIAVAPDGAALITGVCKTVQADPGCQAVAPLLMRFEGAKPTLTIAAAPSLGDAGAAPAFSFDGQSAYFFGHREKDDRAVLFVSHDGGETFTERSLDAPMLPADSAAKAGDAERDEEDEEPGDQLNYNETSLIRPGEDGVVALSLVRPSGAVHVTTDEDGRVQGVAWPPVEEAMIGGAGSRLLAIAPRADREGALAWESLDSGAVWREVVATRAVAHEFFHGTPAITCGSAGCLVGESVSRVGWGGQVEQPSLDGPPADVAPRMQRQVRTPIVCEVAASSRWTRIEDAYPEGDGGLPTEDQTMRGRALWTVLSHDDETKAVSVTAAMLPDSGTGETRVVTRSLLGRAAASTAIRISPQMEGYGVARARYAVNADGELKVGTPMLGVEIAWENYMDGTSGRRTLADAGLFEEGDVALLGKYSLLQPGLISVSPRGIFFRPHRGSATTFFLDVDNKTDRFQYPSWPEQGLGRDLGVHGDIVFTEGQYVGVALIEQPAIAATAYFLARRGGPAGSPGKAAISAAPDPWEIRATSLGPPDRDLVSITDWTYAGPALGITTLIADPKRSQAWGTFSTFRGDGTFGPSVPIPTQLDLPAMPRPCTAAERASTPRIDAPLLRGRGALLNGTRHPILVSEPAAGSKPGSRQNAGTSAGAPTLLLTSSTVLHGTPSSPCVAGWHAHGAGGSAFRAILPGDLTRAFLFRRAEDEARQTRAPRITVEYRPMTCRFDPQATVPEPVFAEPGTLAAATK